MNKNKLYFSSPIGVIGLGYVGLPLAYELSKKYFVKAFDKSFDRIAQLNKNIDRTNQITKKKLINISRKIEYSSNLKKLKNCKIYIIAVPTPVYNNKKPDLRNLKSISKNISKIIKKDDIIIYESTVYPGVTEEICVPLIEKFSNLKLNKDFYVGYSPERINPGDKTRQLTDIVKITSASNKYSLSIINKLYNSIIKVGTKKVSSIKIAESAKVIENAQRDINIAFMNELSIIFNKMNINFNEVLDASKTKWNFLNFEPGLVGGHCIGVDPYYLAYKSKKIGYSPKIILSGRIINNNVITRIVNVIIKRMTFKKIKIKKSKILFLGFSFKENVGDIRYSLTIDIANKLQKKGSKIYLHDPLVDNNFNNNNLINLKKIPNTKFDVVILTVPHKKVLSYGKKVILELVKKNGIFIDLKNKIKTKKSEFSL